MDGPDTNVGVLLDRDAEVVGVLAGDMLPPWAWPRVRACAVAVVFPGCLRR